MTLYELLRYLHISCVVITVSLLTIRLAGDWVAWSWRSTPLRFIPHINDTFLLIAGVGMFFVAQFELAQQPWLIIKIIALPFYIVFGKFALDTGKTARTRIAAALAAYTTLLLIIFQAISKTGAAVF